MSEETARAWVEERFGSNAVDQLEHFASLVRAESQQQNLVSPSTLDQLWERHILDSAQLVPLAPQSGAWLDIGTGGGFPGIVVAISRRDAPIVMAEPRRLRASFLERVVRELRLSNADVDARKVEYIDMSASVISARAVAPIEKLLHAATGSATTKTRWLLPRGRGAGADLHLLRQRWTGLFHVEHSLTDPASKILVLDGPTPRGKRP